MVSVDRSQKGIERPGDHDIKHDHDEERSDSASEESLGCTDVVERGGWVIVHNQGVEYTEDCEGR